LQCVSWSNWSMSTCEFQLIRKFSTSASEELRPVVPDRREWNSLPALKLVNSPRSRLRRGAKKWRQRRAKYCFIRLGLSQRTKWSRTDAASQQLPLLAKKRLLEPPCKHGFPRQRLPKTQSVKFPHQRGEATLNAIKFSRRRRRKR
jgi:hypothetical protein